MNLWLDWNVVFLLALTSLCGLLQHASGAAKPQPNPPPYRRWNDWRRYAYSQNDIQNNGVPPNIWYGQRFQMEDPVKSEVYEAMRRDALENNLDYGIQPNADEERRRFIEQRKQFNEMKPVMPEGEEYAVHSIPGLSDPKKRLEDPNVFPPDALQLGWGPHIPAQPFESNFESPVWNEEGQFWGYRPAPKPKPAPPTTYSNYDDGSCIPPFCIPIQCPENDCRTECQKRGSKCKDKANCGASNCNIPCRNGGVCRDNSCCCGEQYMGKYCEVMRPKICQKQHQIICNIGCVQLDDNKINCVCNPWRNDEKNCERVDLEIFYCPQGCNGRGSCEKETRKCTCFFGYTGDACEVRDFCSDSSIGPKCEHSCMNTQSGRRCTCEEGFQLSQDEYSCIKVDSKCASGWKGNDCQEDIDECLSNMHNCEQICTNVKGSYRCSCERGFYIDRDNPNRCKKETCLDTCEHGSCDERGKCICNSGYEGENCSNDIDECTSRSTNTCEQICVNENGTFRCECEQGYRKDERDRNRCVKDSCDPQCVPGQGDCVDGRCICRSGFLGINCEQDIDECSSRDTNDCEQVCINEQGSYRCDCERGFQIDYTDPRRCVQTVCNPQCVTRQGECVEGRCRCFDGFEGEACERSIDKCASKNTNDCEQICINENGGFRCECEQGFEIDKRDSRRCVRTTCNPQCLPGQGDCNEGRCVCRDGFEGEACERDINECALRLDNCEHKCINKDGGFYCECHDGFEVDRQAPNRCIRRRCDPDCVPGQGECIDGVCKCLEGFTGSYCEKDVDECLTKTHRCEHQCVNSHGSYYCECNKGYVKHPQSEYACIEQGCNPQCVLNQGQCIDGRCICEPGYTGPSCAEDIDECRENRHGCEHECINTSGGFECRCRLGYELDPYDKKRCTQVRCSPSCVDRQGSCVNGQCKCLEGFTGSSCENDVDECALRMHNCDQICENTFGSFKCRCESGFEISQYEPNRCERKECRPNCIPGQGFCEEGRCRCNSGYEGISCERDIDECALNLHDCEQNCRNTPGSYECECQPGYQLDIRDTRRCMRVGCDPRCIPGQGSCENGRCVCKQGFEGEACERDVDECAMGFHNCEQNCVNTDGSYRCECQPGFELDARDSNRCNPINVCNPPCQPGNGNCVDRQCICKEGYSGRTCAQDVDECALGIHRCEQKCENRDGSYDCSCYEGYQIDPYNPRKCLKRTCNPPCVSNQGSCSPDGRCICFKGYRGIDCSQDIDECVETPGVCSHKCVNTNGGYECQCPLGYRVDVDNPSECKRFGCDGTCVNGECDVMMGICRCRPGYTGKYCNDDLDECEANKHECEQVCVNTRGYYKCDCYPGYQIDPYRPHNCVMIAETACTPQCEKGKGVCVDGKCKCNQGYSGDDCSKFVSACQTMKPCDQICVDQPDGNYDCSCQDGFTPVPGTNGRQCKETCRPGFSCFHGKCLNKASEDAMCECDPGWRGKDCNEDIDECKTDKSKCQQICRNLPGSYDCACERGFVLQPDGNSCVRGVKPTDCGGGCLNGGRCLAGNKCFCLQGFKGDRCEQRIDFCKQLNPCEQECYNTAGGGYRCSCKLGFELGEDGKSCQLAKKCPEPCANSGRCYQGKCLCAPGYQGVSCDEDIDECQLPASVHRCERQCVNTVGSYECICPDGYFRLQNKKTCVRKRPDNLCDPPCRNGGTCKSDNVCQCLSGFEGADCTSDIDECQRRRPCSPEHARCRNLHGGFECICNEGYVLMLDGLNCMTEREAELRPDMIHRGKTQKGIVLGRKVGCPDCFHPQQPAPARPSQGRRKRRSNIIYKLVRFG